MKCGGDDAYRRGAYCGGEIHPGRDKWIANHDCERAHNGSDEPPNVRPRCHVCDSRETPHDISFIAKGKRQSDSIYGVKRPRSKLRKPEGMKYSWSERRYVRVDDERQP